MCTINWYTILLAFASLVLVASARRGGLKVQPMGTATAVLCIATEIHCIVVCFSFTFVYFYPTSAQTRATTSAVYFFCVCFASVLFGGLHRCYFCFSFSQLLFLKLFAICNIDCDFRFVAFSFRFAFTHFCSALGFFLSTFNVDIFSFFVLP